MLSLSSMTSRLIGQHMFQLRDTALRLEQAGRNVIHCEIGDLDCGAPDTAISATCQSLASGDTKYTSSIGLAELRVAVAEYAQGTHGFVPETDQVLIAPANAIVDYAVRCICDPGDEVILPDPGFPTYGAVLSYTGVVPRFVTLRSERDYRMKAADVRSKITPRTRLIIINSPHNPTGACLGEDDVREIAEVAAERSLFVLSDEVYARLVYKGAHVSPGLVDHCRERTIVIGSLSKSHAMSGWRLGYALAPSFLVEKMSLLQQTILSCLPAFTQRGAIAALGDHDAFVDDLSAELRGRRDRLLFGLRSLPGIECSEPHGAFYLFPRISISDWSETAYAHRLLHEEGVCVLPGTCFGAAGIGHIRMAYGAMPDGIIDETLIRMQRFHRRYCVR